MRVFVAGGSGVMGRRLVPQLVALGHQVTATTTTDAKLGLLEQLGAQGVVMDGLDAAAVGEAVASARPDVIVNQMTGLSEAHAGKPNLRNASRFFAMTNRLRRYCRCVFLYVSNGPPMPFASAVANASGISDGATRRMAVAVYDLGSRYHSPSPVNAASGTASTAEISQRRRRA